MQREAGFSSVSTHSGSLVLLSVLHIPQSGEPDGQMRFQMPEAVTARENHHYVSLMFTFQGVQAFLPKNDTVEYYLPRSLAIMSVST